MSLCNASRRVSYLTFRAPAMLLNHSSLVSRFFIVSLFIIRLFFSTSGGVSHTQPPPVPPHFLPVWTLARSPNFTLRIFTFFLFGVVALFFFNFIINPLSELVLIPTLRYSWFLSETGYRSAFSLLQCFLTCCCLLSWSVCSLRACRQCKGRDCHVASTLSHRSWVLS